MLRSRVGPGVDVGPEPPNQSGRLSSQVTPKPGFHLDVKQIFARKKKFEIK